MKVLCIAACVGAYVVALFGLGMPAYAAEKPATTPSAQPAASDAANAAAQARADDARLRASCANNLKQMGIVFKMFANESKGEYFPCLSTKAGCLAVANKSEGMNEVSPEYLTDLNVLICPALNNVAELKEKAKNADVDALFDDHSYYYLGYAVTNEDELKAFAEAYKDRIAKGLPFNEDLTTAGGKTVYRLREGVERFYITDINDPASAARAQSEIPVLIERPGHHNPEGGNVLFMDGHVEFIKFSGEGNWPLSKTALEILKSLDETKAPKK